MGGKKLTIEGGGFIKRF